MNFQYRSDIQGLRALAVLFVFGSHAHLPGFSGGFIGVDMFFVISGYVITQLLFKQYKENGKLNLLEFYSHRLLRLAPALLFMVVLVLAVVALIQSQRAFSSHLVSAQMALAWLSNFYFLSADTNYFAVQQNQSFFLHTWSLGVEEQFYLVWPIILLAMSGHYGTKDGGMRSHRKIVAYLAALTILGLLLSLALAYMSNMRAFYLSPSRAWQFGTGALAWFLFPACKKKLSTNAARLLSLSAVAILAWALTTFDHQTPYPGVHALVPTLATAILILCYSEVNRLLFSSKIATWIGDMSYSIYLWHWPIILVTLYLATWFKAITIFYALPVTFLFSAFSYYIIEKPLRRHSVLRKKPKSTLLGSILILATTIVSIQFLVVRAGSETLVEDRYTQIRYQLPMLYQYPCDDWYASADLKVCVFGDTSASEEVVVIGDSILLQWFPALEKIFLQQGKRLIVLTKSSCPMLDRPYYYERIKSRYFVCEQWRRAAIQYINERKPELIIMGSFRGYPFSEQEWLHGTKDIVEQLTASAADIALILGTPSLAMDGPNCLADAEKISSLLKRDSKQLSCSSAAEPHRAIDLLKDYAIQLDHLKLIDPSEIVCPDSMCTAESNGIIHYRDSMHLTVDYVLSLSDEFEVLLELNE